MKPRLFMATLICGLLSGAAFILERLALTDIFHGEPNTQLEWKLVNAAFLPVVAFHILGIWSVITALKVAREDRRCIETSASS